MTDWIAIDSRGRTERMSSDERRFVDTNEGFIFDAGTQERAERIVKRDAAYPKLVEALRLALTGLEDFGPDDIRSQVIVALQNIGEDA